MNGTKPRPSQQCHAPKFSLDSNAAFIPNSFFRSNESGRQGKKCFPRAAWQLPFLCTIDVTVATEVLSRALATVDETYYASTKEENKPFETNAYKEHAKTLLITYKTYGIKCCYLVIGNRSKCLWSDSWEKALIQGLYWRHYLKVLVYAQHTKGNIPSCGRVPR